MSGGISAIRGFDYQATVILDLLLVHFENHGPTATIRPEGKDDLDLGWTDAGSDRRRFVQVKKPREDAQTSPNPSPWSLTQTVRELLGDTIGRLTGNSYEQVWVLGDEVEASVLQLVDAGVEAPLKTTSDYWTAIHRLARAEATAVLPAGSPVAKAVSQWRISSSLLTDPARAQSTLIDEVAYFGKRNGAEGRRFAQLYKREVERLHTLLPGVLDRINIVDRNGVETQVADRVMTNLERRYGLQRVVVENTLFRNLRGFINDIAKEPGRCFDREEFEMELFRCIWPHMVPLKAPPPLESDHIKRPKWIAELTDSWKGAAVEVVGISGSGKTRLAAEIFERSESLNPDRVVLYAEVRADVSLRHSLVGVAVELRSRGILEPFAMAVQLDPANETILADLAKALSEATRECLLLLDLVEGIEPPGFARDLAVFIRALPSDSGFRIIAFGQERVFRELNAVEQTQLGVRGFDAPGLHFDEFAALVIRHHPEADRAQLFELFQQITAGRAAGLNVSLAQAFARAQSTGEMAEIAALPAEERLAHAERNRFTRISGGARAGAEKLTCFALPFSRTDAQRVFPEENIGLAIHELLDLGLLRRYNGDAFEMHETVRAGLEGLTALQTRLDAHKALAGWYRERGQIGAVILHLEHAGQNPEAQTLARESFLAGESWMALWPFVARHRLVSASEVIAVIAGAQPVEGAYLLSDILRELGGSSETLINLVRTQSERMFADLQWAESIFRAILSTDPSRLDELIQFVVDVAPNPEAGAHALTWLSFAARRHRGRLGPATRALLDGQPDAIQIALVGLMLHSGGAALRDALCHLGKHPDLIETGSAFDRNLSHMLNLEVHTAEDITDLLAAIPTVSAADMIRARGPLFGPLGGLIWRARKALRGPCVAALQPPAALGSDALVNAIRVLVYLGEPTLPDLCDGLRSRTDAAGTLAKLIPAVVPGLVDWRACEAQVLDQTIEFADRAVTLMTIAQAGRPLDDLLARLEAVDPSEWPSWSPILRPMASMAPFAAALPVLEEALASEDDKAAALLPAIIVQQGGAPEPKVTTILLNALTHRGPMVRRSGASMLARRRDHVALPRLIELYGQEEVEEIQAELAAAIVSSGARSTADLDARTGTPVADQWWCILAHRSRELGAAERLVAIATDHNQLWQIRRAAIAAAGRLPYDAALVHIEASVMAEHSSFTLDLSRNLLAHQTVIHIIAEAARGMELPYQDDRAGFVSLFESYFDNFWKDTDPTGLPSGKDVAAWLYDDLFRESRVDNAALVRLINSLHIPLLQGATLRSLRLCGRPDRIESHLATAGHVWVAMRALLERSKSPERGPELGQRLQALLAGAAWADDRVMNNLIDQLATTPRANMQPRPTETPAHRPPPVTYETANRVLSGGTAEPFPDGSLVLGPLNVDECKALIDLADPAKDPERGERAFNPSVGFTREGHEVARYQTTYRGPSLRDRLRPAIAAANRFGLPMPWHIRELEGPLGEHYGSDFLTCLAMQGDSTRFYTALTEAEDVLMPILCEKADNLSPQLDVDYRLIPALTRFLSVGGDDLFKGLCILAKRIDTPEIQVVLEGLLHRWTHQFDVKADRPQNDEAFSLWNGFARLSEHPRFVSIPHWQQRLEAVLRAPMAWYHAQSIVRVLEQNAGSYPLIEARLVAEANWEHFREDEVELLDRAAESLFGQFDDTSVR